MYPVTGWWKDSPTGDRSEHVVRYSLVVSIETERTDVDIYTPVQARIAVPILVET